MNHSHRRDFLRMIWAAAAAGAVARATPESATARLQMLPNGTAMLHWMSNTRGTGLVEWRVGDGAATESALTERELKPGDTGLEASLWVYSASLAGLPENSSITYRLRWNGSIGDDQVFRTPGPRGLNLSFLVVGDSGTGSEEQLTIASRMAAEPDTACVLHTGDLGYPSGSYSELRDRYLRPYSQLMGRAVFFPCPGNHEYYTQNVRPYQELRMGGSRDLTYYSVQYGPLHLISVDSNDPLIPPVEENRMLAWLERELSQSRSFWRIVMYHHPPYTAGMHKDDSFVLLSKERLAPLMDKYAVPMVLCGHEHLYQRTLPVRDGVAEAEGRGTVYITTGGGGGPLYPYTPHLFSAAGVSAYHYLKARIEGGRLSVSTLGLSGEELDHFEIAPRPDALRVVNAADGTTRLAPGCLALLTGAHLQWDGEARLYCGDQRLEVLDTQPGRFEFQAPLDQRDVLRLRVETANGNGFVDAALSETAPALFQLGTEAAVEPGSVVTLYATGLGTWPAGAGSSWIRMLVNDAPVGLLTEPDAMPEPGVFRLRFVLPVSVTGNWANARVRAGSAESGTVALRVKAAPSPGLPV